MIVYHPAFDLYHSVFRMLQILIHFNKSEYVELDRLRIWDFYLLFPNKMHSITLNRTEDDIKGMIKKYIPKKDNPYELFLDNRKMFEKIKPYQLHAIKCLVSYNIIDKEYLKTNKIKIISKENLTKYVSKFEELDAREKNVITLLTSHFYLMSLYGDNGLKDKTKLLESRYDAQ